MFARKSNNNRRNRTEIERERRPGSIGYRSTAIWQMALSHFLRKAETSFPFCGRGRYGKKVRFELMVKGGNESGCPVAMVKWSKTPSMWKSTIQIWCRKKCFWDVQVISLLNFLEFGTHYFVEVRSKFVFKALIRSRVIRFRLRVEIVVLLNFAFC